MLVLVCVQCVNSHTIESYLIERNFNKNSICSIAHYGQHVFGTDNNLTVGNYISINILHKLH